MAATWSVMAAMKDAGGANEGAYSGVSVGASVGAWISTSMGVLAHVEAEDGKGVLLALARDGVVDMWAPRRSDGLAAAWVSGGGPNGLRGRTMRCKTDRLSRASHSSRLNRQLQMKEATGPRGSVASTAATTLIRALKPGSLFL